MKMDDLFKDSLDLPLAAPVHAFVPKVTEAEMEAVESEVEGLHLREHQLESVDGLKAGIRQGKRNQILCSPTGSGKSLVGVHLLNECMQKGKKSVFVVERLTLIDQFSEMLDRYNIPHGVIQGDHWRNEPNQLIQVATAQTLSKRGWPSDLALILVDECFPAGTLIDGTPIENIQTGDLVSSFNHQTGAVENKRVLATMKKQVSTLVQVIFNGGESIICTPEHPFCTNVGYVTACDLSNKHYIFKYEVSRTPMSYMWQHLSNCAKYFWKCKKRESESPVLPTMQGKKTRANITGGIRENDALSGCRKKGGDEGQQSYEGLSNKREDASIAINYWPSTFGSWWQWPSCNSATTDIIRRAWGWMGVGVYFPQRNWSKKKRLSASLQNRYWTSNSENSDRGRWWKSLFSCKTGTGLEKNQATSRIRVESVKVLEQGHYEEHGIRSSNDQRVEVFNIEVEGNNNYFAGGVLVHNCHQQQADTLKRIAKRDCITIGLTATPFSRSLGKHYSGVVNVTTTNKLTEDGFLCPFRVFASKEPDMKGAKVDAFGEWTNKDSTERSMKIVGDVVSEYKKHCDGQQFIAFGTGIEHCAELRKQFMAAGIVCELHVYKTPKQERIDNMLEFRKPDSYIKGLLSVSALSRGLDVPQVSCIVMCRPLKTSFAEHIQILGRGLRTFPNKEICTVLDLAGNCIRFWDQTQELFENGVHELDMGEKKEKDKPKDIEPPPPRKCPKCFAVHKRSPKCPACGFEYPIINKAQHEVGELLELGGSKITTKADKFSMEFKANFHAQLVSIQQARGYKDGWTANQYKQKFGVWPKGFDTSLSRPASADVAGYVKSRQIAYFKWKQKH